MFTHRPRRLRQSPVIRTLVQETSNIKTSQLICPLFITDGECSAIESMPGQYRHDIDSLMVEIGECYELGLRSFALFPVIDASLKSSDANEALNPNGLIPNAIKQIKAKYTNILLITDIALDPFTTHGHDGLIDENGNVLNDSTVELLAQMAVVHAEAGADIVAPSDMMDGRVGAIRGALDQAGLADTLILSYAVKYASAFYGPFRDALSSHLSGAVTDKKTYQMDSHNAKEAEKEALLDIEEGADMLMVKPGLAYLDIIHRVSEVSEIPLIAYAVSGEYSMIKAASGQGWLNERDVIEETMTAYIRAGASGVITYHAKDIASYNK